MPAILQTSSATTEQLLATRQIYSQRDALSRSTQGAIRAHAIQAQTDRKMTELRSRKPTSSNLANPNLKWTILGAIPAAYVCDFLLVSPGVHYLVQSTFESNQNLAWAAKLGFPGAVILMELALASNANETHERWSNGLGPRSHYEFWRFLGALFAIAVPLMALAFSWAAFATQPEGVRQTLAIALTLFAIVPHLVIVMSRSTLLNAIEGFSYERKERAALAAQAQAQRLLDDSHATVATSFREYAGNVNEFMAQWPGRRLALGGFSDADRRELMCVHGYDPLPPRPNVAVQNPALPPVNPTDANNGGVTPTVDPIQPQEPQGGDGELQGAEDYWQQILRRRQAEDDSVVRPER